MPPAMTHIVHGEFGAAEALAGAIRQRLNWEVHVPKDGEEVSLFDSEKSPTGA